MKTFLSWSPSVSLVKLPGVMTTSFLFSSLPYPKILTGSFYLKVFDPDCGGQHDEIQGVFDTKTLFSVYGGKGVDPDKNVESRGLKDTDNYKQGNLLASKVFGNEPTYDNRYYAFRAL
ncbi:MAG: hypothetical protein IPI69_02155 [Bacteroidales bacterium]|nr:hypothetical protein [Bacteroidales bacterium]